MQEFVGGDQRVYAAQGNQRRGTVLNRPSSSGVSRVCLRG